MKPFLSPVEPNLCNPCRCNFRITHGEIPLIIIKDRLNFYGSHGSKIKLSDRTKYEKP